MSHYDAITERVQAGAAFLDEREPGWDTIIDLDRLDLGSSCLCVLGQLEISMDPHAGSYAYTDHLDRLRLRLSRDDNPFRLGFNTRSDYEPLTAAWRDLITARRAGAS